MRSLWLGCLVRYVPFRLLDRRFFFAFVLLRHKAEVESIFAFWAKGVVS